MKNFSRNYRKTFRCKSALLFSFFTLSCGAPLLHAQTETAADRITAQPVGDRIVPYRLSEKGVVRPVEWGLDTAWESDANIRTGSAYMGSVDIVRVSFRPTHPVVDGDLNPDQKKYIQNRLRLAKLAGPNVKLMVNSDHPKIDNSYKSNAANWAEMMDLHVRYFQEGGFEVVSVAPFNEPDYSYTGQGTKEDFYNIAVELRKNPRYKNIRISGGNTLNSDEALPWYNFLKDQLDEGNTHQLAGSFDGFAGFFEAVRRDGKHATADEMHNVMEAMVGLEYGLQTGIWWGPAEYTRGEFCKTSRGERLGYTEHRLNWTAASVYRAPDGRVQAFGGTSERQAATTTYRFISQERDVFFDGHGPQREYVMELPGGKVGSYQEGQTNAEGVVNITWGEDIQPVIDGRYVLVNRKTGRVIEIANGETQQGANVKTGRYSNAKEYQQWYVKPVSTRIGGDFSYYYITSYTTGMSFDIWNWSLEEGGNIAMYGVGNGTNQQWVMEYAEDGWFRIRSRYSALYLEEVEGNVQQEGRDDSYNQQWRLVPAPAAKIEIKTLIAPAGLVAESQTASVLLKWNKQTDATVYTVLRAESAGGDYEIIARNVTGTSFIDHKIPVGKTCYYTVKATDDCLNSSPRSQEVAVAVSGARALVAHYDLDENLKDATENLKHGASVKAPTFTSGKIGNAVLFDGETDFVQLPGNIAGYRNLTVSAWMRWREDGWLKVFDFGNGGEDEYMYLACDRATKGFRFVMKDDGVEQKMETTLPSVSGSWLHLAVTIGDEEIRIYVNGELAVSSRDITIRPVDFNPALNYIGRSHAISDPLFSGVVDDFRIYNYELSGEDIKTVSQGGTVGITRPQISEDELVLGPLPAQDKLQVWYTSTESSGRVAFKIYNMQGVELMARDMTMPAGGITLDVSGFPSGLYVLRVVDGNCMAARKFTVKH